ncbi:MucR family transcriptional regulator [Limimaricola sp.]|uniref:MucR family transcriptional regulator n=1 Tax=Limimaricola sp. TaxID=2211665 RepID=UPI0040590FAE
MSATAGSGRPPRHPAVPIEASVTPDYIVCLETGRKLVLLRRHLRETLHLTPEEYRARWGLPPEYPMAAPNYLRDRSFCRARGAGSC